jgi:hypothetical protein
LTANGVFGLAPVVAQLAVIVPTAAPTVIVAAVCSALRRVMSVIVVSWFCLCRF